MLGPLPCLPRRVLAEVIPPLALYVHWPFCLSKCPYCDFNSHEASAIDHTRWRDALLTELAWFAAQVPNRTLGTVFFGGGTPSLMEPATVAAILDAAAGHWTVAADVEITLEANPSTVEAARFRDFKGAGINRLSMGFQALDDQVLAFLGRRHDVAEARAALDIAQKTFNRTSFDLIYARPGQSLDAWRRELTEAVTLTRGHLSVYQLTIEEGTAFYPRHERGEFHLPGDEAEADLYDLTQEILERAGLPAYEISNHSAPGMECRHNLASWRGGDYVGIGPGAHGRLDRVATRQHRAPAIWLERVEQSGHGSQEREELSPRQRAVERVMTGLRLTEGVDSARFAALSGMAPDAVLDPGGVDTMIEAGFLWRTPQGFGVTVAGRKLLNAVMERILVP